MGRIQLAWYGYGQPLGTVAIPGSMENLVWYPRWQRTNTGEAHSWHGDRKEYGISKQEKLEIAVGFCLPLIRKIQLDLQRTHEDESVNKLHPLYSRGVLSPGRHVRTRLYFTSESHVHSLLSIFRYGGLLDESKDPQWKRAMDYLSAISELNYMTQIVVMLYEDNNKDPSSEERFHVELHFSPGVKGCEEDGSAPAGSGFRPASAEKEAKKPEQGSLDDLAKSKGADEVDQIPQLSPQPAEPVYLQRRSPLIRNRKTGSMEVLSEASSKAGGYRLFSYSRHSSEVKQSGLGSQCTGLFSTTVLGGSSSAPNLQDYARSHGKKFASGFLYKDELLSMPAVKRFSVSFAKHPTNDELEGECLARLLRRFPSDSAASRDLSLDAPLARHLHQCFYHLRLFRKWLVSGQGDLESLDGFEGCSMVPSIYPLETLHNSLSLRQVNSFLTGLCRSCCSSTHSGAPTAALFDSLDSQAPGDAFMQQQMLSSSSLPLHPRSDRPPWYSSGPSSTVSSAGPSSPTPLDNCPRFSFSEKPPFSGQVGKERLSGQLPGEGPPGAEEDSSVCGSGAWREAPAVGQGGPGRSLLGPWEQTLEQALQQMGAPGQEVELPGTLPELGGEDGERVGQEVPSQEEEVSPEMLDVSEGQDGGASGQEKPGKWPEGQQEKLAGKAPEQGLEGPTCEAALPSPLLPPGESG
ncbi:UNVERIFIED_CONTAM: Inositol hexakisphosphate and diphosphoinositol-pentakisphosphate kinase 1 [Gekko kuhli]